VRGTREKEMKDTGKIPIFFNHSTTKKTQTPKRRKEEEK
jgi:hypothetical protein